MATKTSKKRLNTLDEIRDDDSIEATVYVCRGSRAEFNVSFPSFKRAFAFIKFAKRSRDTTIIRLRETPEDTATNSVAFVRVRVDTNDPAEKVKTLLEFAYDTGNIGL